MATAPLIVFFDLEGTLLRKDHPLDDGLVAPSAWTSLAARLGADCLREENETKADWRAGKYQSYMDWMRRTVEIHQKYGLTETLFLDLVDKAQLMPNVDTAFVLIRRMTVATVLITGGFKALADRVQRTLRITHALAACEYFFDPDTKHIDHVNLLPADEQGKVDFMRLICREYGIAPKECAFVGDGMNDVHLAAEVGFSIAFNGQPELCRVATKCIDQPAGSEDFLPVAHFLESAFS